MKNKLSFGYILSIASYLVLPLLATGQSDSTNQPKAKISLFDLFRKGEMPEITITANFDSIKANVKNKEYVNGTFEVVHSKKSTTKINLKIRPRGKSRRMMCDFPPLKLKFEKSSLKNQGLETFNDFKLVTHCLENSPQIEAVIKREFLIYQLFNCLTPYSFKASLANITYKNTGKSFKKTVHLGIIIEDAESLAHRNNCQTMEQKVIALDSLHQNQEKTTSVFQYMIGNADWSYMMARNMELIQQSDGQIIAVPYDFDYAGLVMAPYARANAALGQKTVLDRVYLGNAKSYEELHSIFSFFKTKKADLFEIIENFDELDWETRSKMRDYVEGFFNIIESKERVEKEMLGMVK